MKQKHGTFWEINPLEGEKTNGLYLGYGVLEPSGRYVHPLRTLECNDESGDFFDSVRYFKKEDESDGACMTKEQAERLTRPELAGKTVMVDVLRNEEPGFPGKERIAKNVFYNEQRLAGNFCLDE